MAAGAALVLLAAGCVNPPGGDGGTTPSTPGGPVAVANASPTVGDAPLTVSFSSSGSNLGDGTGVLFTWDFGDGSPFGTGASVIHVYEEVGTYQAQLTISTTLGTSVSAPITIVVNQSVNPAFHVRPGGSTGPDCGPLLDPCSTITQAQQNALENGVRTIKVAGGVYGPLQVASGMEILGGFLSDFSAVSPAVTSVVLGTGDSDPVTFDGVSNATINRIHAVGVVRTSGDAVGVRVTGGSSGIQIQASEVAGGEGPNATGVVVEQQSSVAIAATRVNSGTTVGEGSSAYGVRVVQRSSAHISASAITAQRGADGVDAPSAVPPRGANGCPGRNGGSGSGANGAGAGGLGGKPDPNGGCIGGVASANPSPINGGDGGKGKGDSSSIAQPGKPGGPNGTGGAGGASGGHHDPGGAGGAGRSGDAGEAGKAGINDPDVAAGVLWSPPDGTPGGDGQDGTGGGGGGGGGEGALITSGGGGGGGGGAGKGGKGGVAGGTSGGGSFGIYAHDSFVTVTSNTTVTAAEGGRGGNGAPGGKGGNGAKGGNGGGKSCCAADGGGGGGGGGAGGGGAGAGGGAGGPSIALFNEGTGTLTRNVSEANLKVASTTAPGGLGGAGSAAATPGGSSSGADGAPGGPAAPPGKPGPAGFDGPSGLTVRIWDNG